MSKSKNTDQQLTFEAAMAELEQLVEKRAMTEVQ